MYDAWKDPKTLSIISKIAGVDLVPVMDIEVGSINISVRDPEHDFGRATDQADDDVPITRWHVDSYPFVCVVMMSDASGMVGGETALQSGSGEILKVRGPQMVSFPVNCTWIQYSDNLLGLCCRSSRQVHSTSGTRRSRWT